MFFSKNPLGDLDSLAKIALLFLLAKLVSAAESESLSTTTSNNTTGPYGLLSWLSPGTLLLILFFICCVARCIFLCDRDEGTVLYGSGRELENGLATSPSSTTPLLEKAGSAVATQTYNGAGSDGDAPPGDDGSNNSQSLNL